MHPTVALCSCPNYNDSDRRKYPKSVMCTWALYRVAGGELLTRTAVSSEAAQGPIGQDVRVKHRESQGFKGRRLKVFCFVFRFFEIVFLLVALTILELAL